MVPVLPHDHGGRFQPNTDGAALIDKGTLVAAPPAEAGLSAENLAAPKGRNSSVNFVFAGLDQGFNDSGLKTRPSGLFRRNCWISFEPVEGSFRVLADYIRPHKILWATDYPHRDGFFPGAPDMVRQRLEGTSPETKHQVLAGGAIGFYGLN